MKQGTLIISLCALNLLGLIVFASVQFSSPSRVVYVDAIKVLAGYKGMATAKKEFESKVSQWRANLDTLKLELESKLSEYEAKHTRLSSKEKELMEELLEAKRGQYENYETLIAEKINKEDQELTTKVYSKVNDYLKRYGEQKGYSFILAANQYGSIVYADSAVNITDEVIAGLNHEYGK